MRRLESERRLGTIIKTGAIKGIVFALLGFLYDLIGWRGMYLGWGNPRSLGEALIRLPMWYVIAAIGCSVYTFMTSRESDV